MKGGGGTEVISNSRLLINELKRMSEKSVFDDFLTEYITIDVDGTEYLIDSICVRNTHSDPVMKHLCLKTVKPQDIGGGIIR